MSFRKTSKGEGGIFNSKIYIADFKPLYSFFFSKKILQYKFPKMRWGGGVRGRLEFFRKFIRLVALPVPYTAFTVFSAGSVTSVLKHCLHRVSDIYA